MPQLYKMAGRHGKREPRSLLYEMLYAFKSASGEGARTLLHHVHQPCAGVLLILLRGAAPLRSQVKPAVVAVRALHLMHRA
eukprot:6199609-Pleurochrysis_carterae.AAC.6